jgi:hypothetical protein
MSIKNIFKFIQENTFIIGIIIFALYGLKTKEMFSTEYIPYVPGKHIKPPVIHFDRKEETPIEQNIEEEVKNKGILPKTEKKLEDGENINDPKGEVPVTKVSLPQTFQNNMINIIVVSIGGIIALRILYVLFYKQ